MPPVYTTISFFSYRFFRDYTYYFLAESIYEALAVAAFLMLLITYVGESTEEQKQILADKDKRKIPFPLCCWRYRPRKPYFMHTLKVRGMLQSLCASLTSGFLSGPCSNTAYSGP